MAYVVGTNKTEAGSTASITVVLPSDLQDDDYIIMIAAQDGGGGVHSCSGYVEIPGTAQANVGSARSSAWIKKASLPETDPTVTSAATDQMSAVVVIVRDADETTAIDIAAQTDATTGTPTCPTVTTTADDQLVLRVFGGADNTGVMRGTYDGKFINRALSTSNVAVHATSQVTAGATGTARYYSNATDGSSCYTIAFKNKTGAGASAKVSLDATPVAFYGLVGNFIDSYSFSSMGASITTLAGQSVTTTNFTVSHNAEFGNDTINDTASTFSPNVAGPIWIGQEHSITSTDFSGKTVCMTMGPDRTSETGPNGMAVVLFDSSSNWAAFKLDISQSATFNLGYSIFFGENSSPLDSSGTLDWTDITKVAVAWDREQASTTGRAVRFKDLILFGSAVVTGGNSVRPVSPAIVYDFLKPYESIDYAGKQGLGQILAKRPITIGNGTDKVYYRASTESLENPADADQTYQIVANQNDLRIYASSDSTIDFSASINRVDVEQNFVLDPSTSTSATYSFLGASIIGYAVTWKTGVDCVGASFINSGIIDAKAATFEDCVFTESRSTTHAVEVDAGASITDSAFTKGSETYALEIAAAGTYSINGTTFSGYTTEINVTASTGTVTINLAVGQSEPSYTSAGATVTFVQPTDDLTVTSSESSSLIQIFTTGTQTVLDSTTGTSLVFTHTGQTVDIVVQKEGFLPQRRTGILLSGTTTQAFVLDTDFNYNPSHGMVYTTDFSYDRALEEVTLVSTTNSSNDLWSAMIDAFIAQTTLRNTEFKFSANGSSLYLLDDAEFASDANAENLTGAGGVRYVDSTDTVSAEWCGIVTDGIAAGLQAEYQQQDGSGTTDASATGDVSQLVKIYGDATHGNFDYRGHQVWKVQANDYREVRIDVLSQYAISSLQPASYVLPMSTTAIDITTGDPGITGVTITKEATPVSYNAGDGAQDFSITILDSNTNAGDDIRRWIKYNLSLDATFQGLDPFNWQEMVVGTETIRGIIEGDSTPVQHGVYITRDGSSPHPDFTRFQADNGNYTAPLVSASVSITGMPTTGANIRLQIINNTAESASAWQATTAYSAGDKVLRTTGVGSENTAGLYFVATTAGTSGGTEPAWSTTVGNTTNDGTVVWTCYAVLFYDDDPGASTYNTTYTDGEEFSSGDSGTVRFAEMDGGTSFKTYDTTFITTSDGFSVVVSTSSDDVYASNAIDGSSAAVTGKFTADYVNDELDLDANLDWTNPEAYAFFSYELTKSQGMYAWWGGVTAIDVANYRNNTAVVSMYFDETAGFVKQTDNSRWYRDDGLRPALDPTTGGAGLEINWKNPVYLEETGVSGLTPPESAQLFSLDTDNLDVAVSTRNSVVPDNASITTIKERTDNLPDVPASKPDVFNATQI